MAAQWWPRPVAVYVQEGHFIAIILLCWINSICNDIGLSNNSIGVKHIAWQIHALRYSSNRVYILKIHPDIVSLFTYKWRTQWLWKTSRNKVMLRKSLKQLRIYQKGHDIILVIIYRTQFYLYIQQIIAVVLGLNVNRWGYFIRYRNIWSDQFICTWFVQLWTVLK